MNQNLLIAIISFIVAVQPGTRINVGPKFATFVAVILPYIFSLIFKLIYIKGYDLPIAANLFSLGSVIAFILQLLLSYIVFRKIQEEENIATILGWAMGGFIVIIFLIPFIAQQIVL